jgi:hypothetical protein
MQVGGRSVKEGSSMKLCGVCDLSIDLLKQTGDRLVHCAECADTVCTRCVQSVKDENGKTVYVCSECSVLAVRFMGRRSR